MRALAIMLFMLCFHDSIISELGPATQRIFLASLGFRQGLGSKLAEFACPVAQALGGVLGAWWRRSGGLWEAVGGVLEAVRGALEDKRSQDIVKMAQELANSKIPQE